jgi:hypothetical protein
VEQQKLDLIRQMQQIQMYKTSHISQKMQQNKTEKEIKSQIQELQESIKQLESNQVFQARNAVSNKMNPTSEEKTNELRKENQAQNSITIFQ